MFSFSRLSLCLSVVAMSLCATAQDRMSPKIQETANACIKIRNAITDAGSATTMRTGLSELEALDVEPFTALRRKGKAPSINGHFIYGSEFITDILKDPDGVYRRAQEYRDRMRRTHRGSSTSNGVKLLNDVATAGGSAVYTLAARGTQYIAVVAEPGGKVTLRIHNLTTDEWYKDTVDERTGRAYRAIAMQLPDDRASRLEIEVINTSADTDTSFAIIGN